MNTRTFKTNPRTVDSSKTPGADIPAESALNIACVGAGYWGKNLIRNFHDLGVLRAVCDRCEDALKRFSTQYPDIPSCDSIRQLLEDETIHAVVVATPAETHYELIMQALSAGKHVYIEKPLCLDEHQAQECIELSDATGLTLMVGHLLWYHPMVLEISRAIQAGELGQIHYVYSNRLNMGLLRSEENVLWSFAPHDISLILGLAGSSPCSVEASASSHLQQGIADHAIGILKFEDGLGAHVFVSWMNPFKEQKLVVVGDAAMMVFDDTLPWDQKLARYAHAVAWEGSRPKAIKAVPEHIRIPQAEPLKEACRHFIHSILSASRPRTDGHEGLRVLRVLNQLQDSMDT